MLLRSFGRVADLAFVGGLLCLLAYGVFVLPYRFPPRELTAMSESFAAGFNNRVAVLAMVVGVSVLSLRKIAKQWFAPESVDATMCVTERRSRMPMSALWTMLAIYVGMTVFLYWCIPFLDEYGESTYAVPRLELALKYHLRPYVDIQWAYGPVLFYVPLAFMAAAQALHIPVQDGFVAGYIVLLLVGVWMLFFLCDHFRIKATHRVLIFALVALSQYEFGFAVQGSFIRPLAPYVMLVVFHKALTKFGPARSAREVLLLLGITVGCVVAVLSTALEMGIIFTAAISAYCGYVAFTSDRTRLYAVVAAVATVAAWWLLFPGAGHSMGRFSSGAGNLPVYPSIFIIPYLLCILWLPPLLVGSCFSSKRGVNAPFALAYAAMIVMHMPPCLSRCDPPHAFGQGMGMFVAAFAVFVRNRPRLFPVVLVVFLLIYVHLYRAMLTANYTPLQKVQAALGGNRESNYIPPSPLIEPLGLKSFPSVGLPLGGVDRATKEFLLDTGRYVVEYHPEFQSVCAPEDVDRKMEDAAKASVVLVPDIVLRIRAISDVQFMQAMRARVPDYDKRINAWLGFVNFMPVHFQSRQVAYDPWMDAARRLSRTYDPVRAANGWVVMKLRAPAGSATQPATEATPKPSPPPSSQPAPG
ncbi:MAG: hypothetical protein NTW19_12705 [Planctomycetota bacterium]|nr:hypothetical protein [Planctomycetota bacterium]